jgi:hypothetical protein
MVASCEIGCRPDDIVVSVGERFKDLHRGTAAEIVGLPVS